jgi:hypothetical protein
LSHPGCPRQDRQPRRCREMGAQQHRAALGTLSRGNAPSHCCRRWRHNASASSRLALPSSLFLSRLLQQACCWRLLQGLYWPPSWPAGCGTTLVAGDPSRAFMPLAVVLRALDLPAWLWPPACFCLVLVFWRTDRNRVPLYLSSRKAPKSVLPLLPDQPCRVSTSAAATGALLRHLARKRARTVGLSASNTHRLPWLWARLAGRSLPNLKIVWGRFLEPSPGGYDLVYAFLSPAPMSRLWVKASREMRSGRAAGQQQLRGARAEADSRIAVTTGQ